MRIEKFIKNGIEHTRYIVEDNAKISDFKPLETHSDDEMESYEGDDEKTSQKKNKKRKKRFEDNENKDGLGI